MKKVNVILMYKHQNYLTFIIINVVQKILSINMCFSLQFCVSVLSIDKKIVQFFLINYVFVNYQFCASVTINCCAQKH